MVPHIFRGSLLTSVNLINTVLHRCGQRLTQSRQSLLGFSDVVLWVILDLVKLTINSHPQILCGALRDRRRKKFMSDANTKLTTTVQGKYNERNA